MKRFGIRHLLLAAPLLALLVVIGCNNAPPPKEGGDGTADTTAKPKGELKELASTGWGTLTGKVTLVGDMPNQDEATKKMKTDMEMHKDKEVCLSGSDTEKNPESWVVNKDNKGVKNVFVWLKPPEGTFFKLPDGAIDAVKNKTEAIDQPHCAFKPHALTLWPSYIDPKTKKLTPTGQKFEVKNSAPIDHNTKWKGSSKNDDNVTIKSGQEHEVKLVPDSKPVTISCSIHGWMNAYAGVFDHPYAALTNENGEYTIEKVPTGVDLQVIAWHEVGGFLGKGKAKGDTHKLDEKNTINFDVSAPK